MRRTWQHYSHSPKLAADAPPPPPRGGRRSRRPPVCRDRVGQSVLHLRLDGRQQNSSSGRAGGAIRDIRGAVHVKVLTGLARSNTSCSSPLTRWRQGPPSWRQANLCPIPIMAVRIGPRDTPTELAEDLNATARLQFGYRSNPGCVISTSLSGSIATRPAPNNWWMSARSEMPSLSS